MKIKKPIEVSLKGEAVKVVSLRGEGRITIERKNGIKDTGYLFEELPIEDQKKVLNRVGYYHYNY